MSEIVHFVRETAEGEVQNWLLERKGGEAIEHGPFPSWVSANAFKQKLEN